LKSLVYYNILMDLIIVESPTKAKTLAKFLGDGFEVQATMGHIRDLPEKKLGVDVKKDFEPEYVVSEAKAETIEKLKKLAQKAEKIFLATDPDREGEAIAWHVSALLSGNSKFKIQNSKFSRVTFHEITKKAIDEALSKPGEININLVEAQTARRILDRLVGYKLSPLLWQKIRRGLSAGRVQSVAVRLIVEREKEIDKFVPIEYWEIEALLQKFIGGEMPDAPRFLAKLVKKNGGKIEVVNQTQSSGIVEELKKAEYEVYGVDKKEFKRNPYPPFTTSTLQQAGANRLGWSSKKTMQMAQSLYEKGLITYHRTDSTNLAEEAVAQARDFIKKNYGNDYLPQEPKIYKTKSKSAQEAHEAIRPTELQRDNSPAGGSELQSGDEEKLFKLIWKRFLACQMNPAVVEVTTLTTQAAGEKNIFLFETKGAIQKFDGWRKLYETIEEVDEEGEKIEKLPEVSVGDGLKLLELKPEQKFTAPPPRFNEASLIKTLEELGIGRPSTYAPIISTIQDRNYVEKQNKAFVPTLLGVAVNDFLMDYFANILDYQFTAKMEDEFDGIANGELKRTPVLAEFYTPFIEKLEGVRRVAQRVAVQTEATGQSCPDCKQGSVVVRVGRFGKFLSCSRFPDCHYRAPFVQKVEGFNCPKCGSDVIYKKTKTGKGFYGCASYPKCDFASWRKPTKT